MKKILFTALLVAALLTQMVTFSFAASEFDTNVIIDETYEGSANLGKNLTGFGWRYNDGWSYFKEEVVAEDGNHVMKLAPKSNTGKNNSIIIKDIDDCGEGTYELSYRMNLGKKKMNLFQVLQVNGYTLNEDGSKKKVTVSLCQKSGSYFFAIDNKEGSYFSAANIPDDTWVDYKLMIDTVNNKASIVMGYEDATGNRQHIWRYSTTIAAVDGLYNLQLQLGGNGDDTYDSATATALDSFMIDDLKLTKTDILDASFDFTNENTSLFNISGWTSSEQGWFSSPKVVADGSKLGNVIQFKPSRSYAYDDPATVNTDISGADEEGVYEITYRVNFGDDNTYASDLFRLDGYVSENGTKVNKKLLGISGYGGNYTFYVYKQDGTTRTYSCWAKADSTKWHNKWLDVRYVVDTINNMARVEFGYIDANGNYKTNTDVTSWAILEVEGLSKLYSRIITKANTDSGDFRFDDFKVRKLKSWYDASTGKPVDNLSEIQPNNDGKKIARYVSHYYSTSANAKPTDVYLALYNGDKLAAGVKAETLNVPAWASNKVFELDFELPENLSGLTGNIFKWQPDLTPITDPIAVPVN